MNSTEKQIKNIAQIVMRSTRSRKQVTENCELPFRDVRETLLSVGLGTLVQKETRNKKLIDQLSELGLSIFYKKGMKIEDVLANNVVTYQESNNGLYLPQKVSPNMCLHFAIDNIDFKNDTVDGKGEFHGITKVLLQKAPAIVS